MIKKSDHVHILADYSQSRVIAAMTEAKWSAYYSTSTDMAAMRASHPDAYAAIVGRGAGLWQPDLSTAYVPPSSGSSPSHDDAITLDRLAAHTADPATWRDVTAADRLEDTRLALRLIAMIARRMA